MKEMVLRYLSWYRSFPVVCVLFIPATMEIKSCSSFSSDPFFQLFLLLFLSLCFWKTGCKGCAIGYRGKDPRHVSKREHALFITFETVTPKMEMYFSLPQRGRFKA